MKQSIYIDKYGDHELNPTRREITGPVVVRGDLSTYIGLEVKGVGPGGIANTFIVIPEGGRVEIYVQ